MSVCRGSQCVIAASTKLVSTSAQELRGCYQTTEHQSGGWEFSLSLTPTHTLTKDKASSALRFHKKYMQHPKGAYQVSQGSVCVCVCAQSQRHAAKYVTSASAAPCVGVNMCEGVKLKATAVATKAAFTVKNTSERHRG